MILVHKRDAQHFVNYTKLLNHSTVFMLSSIMSVRAHNDRHLNNMQVNNFEFHVSCLNLSAITLL